MPRISGLIGKNKADRHIRNLSLILLSVLVALAIGEGALRVLGIGAMPDRTLYFNEMPFEQVGKGVRFFSDKTFRTAVVADNEIIYDVEFQTNNRGFIDDRDYQAGISNKRIAIFGDSFTAGYHGGKPWVPVLRQDLELDRNGIELHNYGIAGVGLDNYPALLSGAEGTFEFEHIVVILISDDLWRLPWAPLSDDQHVWFCQYPYDTEACKARRPIATLQAEFDDLKNAKTENIGKTWWKQTHLYQLARTLRQSFVDRELSEDMVVPLKQLQSLQPDASFHVIHIPEQHEIRNGNYDAEVESLVTQTEFKYYPALQHCGVSGDGFYQQDRHPNQKGYDQIRRCVGEYLESIL